MAKGKYEYWLSTDGLLLLSAWARDGLTDEQIAKNCGISRDTLYTWKQRFPDFADALKKGKEIADIEVENALFKSALGYTATVRKVFKVRITEFDEETGRKVREREDLRTGFEDVHVAASPVAQFFWLKNRRPDRWRDKPINDADETAALAKVVAAIRGEAAGDALQPDTA